MLNRRDAGFSSLPGLRAAVEAIHSSLLDLELAISELERREALDDSRGDKSSPVHGSALRPPITIAQDAEIDPVIDRVDDLRLGCEEVLRRPLRGDERPIVLGWALLEREGALVPIGEILELARRLLSRPTPDGTLPSTLKWCDATVQTLARAPVALLLRGQGARNQAAELASLYEKIADHLESQEPRP
jgi:hypothetical protein